MNFRNIQRVQQATNLIDIVLSATQRHTPTVIHSHFSIQRIRSFYMKKIKTATSEFTTRLNAILDEFPRLESIHPFFSDLLNVLYDKDHYKMALGHVNMANKTVESTCKEFFKLLKFGDSLYRCKQLKKACLGKMATSIKKLKRSLEYLEEVRQHMSRLPSIDLICPTLIICGYPNVGKSSLITKVSKAKVDVQPYAFTTKNLFVGHFDYQNRRFQLIDTPGVLDHELDERNTIEMQSIIALVHLKATVLYLIDLSESCGYNLEEQLSLYETISALLKNSIIVFTKSDLVSLEKYLSDKPQDHKLFGFLKDKKYIEISVRENKNIEELKSFACEPYKEEASVFIHYTNELKPKENGDKNLAMEIELDNIIIPEIMNGKNIGDMIGIEIPEKMISFKQYDLLSERELKIKNEIEVAKKLKIWKNSFNKRATIPELWKERINRREYNTEIVMKEPKQKFEKFLVPQKIVNKLPKHLYRGKSKHGKRR